VVMYNIQMGSVEVLGLGSITSRKVCKLGSQPPSGSAQSPTHLVLCSCLSPFITLCVRIALRRVTALK
jgi:hypothetical protein